MPICFALKNHSELQNCIFIEQVAGEAQPERQPVFAQADRHGERGQSAQRAQHTPIATLAREFFQTRFDADRFAHLRRRNERVELLKQRRQGARDFDAAFQRARVLARRNLQLLA